MATILVVFLIKILNFSDRITSDSRKNLLRVILFRDVKKMLANYKLKLNIISFICCLTVLSAPAHARKKAVLLDADGNPLSMEMLTLLSGGKPLPKQQPQARRLPRKHGGTKRVINTKRRNIQGAKPNTLPKSKPLSERPELQRDLLYALKEGKTARAMNLIKSGVKVN